MTKTFWNKLEKPIIGLSPMDGITDAAFRYILCKNSNPDVVFTEFVNVEGLARGAVSMLTNFIFSKSEKPIVAQIYGIETDSFYKVALMVCYLGFDGIDINMGCPANKVARRNSGAGLIRVPEQAKKIIRSVKKATEDWKNGITLEEADLKPKIITHLKEMKGRSPARKLIPVSVKTRMGIDKNIATDWIQILLEEKPVTLTLHGRTLKQMYSGEADWETIGKVAKIVKQTDTVFLGNGDIRSYSDALEKVKTFGTDGALVGRMTCGNPWFFGEKEPDTKQKFLTAIDHSRCFEELMMEHAFFAMRKHLAWYCTGFDGARELRKKLMQTKSSSEVEKILMDFLENGTTQQSI